MFYSRSLTFIALIGTLGLINGAPLLAEQKQEPLYLHWFSLGKPNSSHVATLRVYPNQEFELALGDQQSISGTLRKREGRFHLTAKATHLTPAWFDTPARLDKRLQPHLEVVMSGIVPQFLVLSKDRKHESALLTAPEIESIEKQSERNRDASDKDIPATANIHAIDKLELPFDHLVFRRTDAEGKQLFHLQINKDGSYFSRQSEQRMHKGQLNATAIRDLAMLVNKLPGAGTALEFTTAPLSNYYEVVLVRNGGHQMYGPTELYTPKLAPMRNVLEQLMRQVVVAQ